MQVRKLKGHPSSEIYERPYFSCCFRIEFKFVRSSLIKLYYPSSFKLLICCFSSPCTYSVLKRKKKHSWLEVLFLCRNENKSNYWLCCKLTFTCRQILIWNVKIAKLHYQGTVSRKLSLSINHFTACMTITACPYSFHEHTYLILKKFRCLCMMPDQLAFQREWRFGKLYGVLTYKIYVMLCGEWKL